MAAAESELRKYMQQERSVLHQACWRALVLYLVAGLLWFGAGDAVMPLLVKDQQLYIMLQRAQDYIFVLLSGCYAAWLVACAIRANERREVARQALAQSEEHMRLALEASGIGMWDLDMVSRRHSFSGGMSSMMRYEG